MSSGSQLTVVLRYMTRLIIWLHIPTTNLQGPTLIRFLCNLDGPAIQRHHIYYCYYCCSVYIFEICKSEGMPSILGWSLKSTETFEFFYFENVYQKKKK